MIIVQILGSEMKTSVWRSRLQPLCFLHPFPPQLHPLDRAARRAHLDQGLHLELQVGDYQPRSPSEWKQTLALNGQAHLPARASSPSLLHLGTHLSPCRHPFPDFGPATLFSYVTSACLNQLYDEGKAVSVASGWSFDNDALAEEIGDGVTFADAWSSSAHNALVVTADNEDSVLKVSRQPETKI